MQHEWGKDEAEVPKSRQLGCLLSDLVIADRRLSAACCPVPPVTGHKMCSFLCYRLRNFFGADQGTWVCRAGSPDECGTFLGRQGRAGSRLIDSKRDELLWKSHLKYDLSRRPINAESLRQINEATGLTIPQESNRNPDCVWWVTGTESWSSRSSPIPRTLSDEGVTAGLLIFGLGFGIGFGFDFRELGGIQRWSAYADW